MSAGVTRTERNESEELLLVGKGGGVGGVQVA